jgi:hypothetical protein
MLAFLHLAHGVEHRPHRPMIGEPVTAAPLIPNLPDPLPAPKDPVAPANNRQQQHQQQQRQNKNISILQDYRFSQGGSTKRMC